MAPPRNHDEQDGANAAYRLRELALHTDPTAQVVLDQANVVLLANERARTLFGLTARDIGRTLQDLELSYRPTDLRSIIDQVTAERRLIIVKDIDWTTHAGEHMFLDVQVMPLLTASSDILGVKVLFRDVTRYRRLEDELKGSHHALETVNEELQSTNEELETTNEELQSTVEELETTNEELQSTNEELETMNEELQSTNEELQTANDQLRHSGEELNRANAFLENLLSSFDDGVAVVDSELRVRAWNSKAEDLWGVRSIEVQGKHLMNLDIGLPVESLLAALRQVLSGGSAFERLTVVATNRRGRKIDLEVSCMPLVVSRNPTWGAILTMEDKTSARPPLTPSTTH
jgi:two-component system CheB/CheR fusion protein